MLKRIRNLVFGATRETLTRKFTGNLGATISTPDGDYVPVYPQDNDTPYAFPLSEDQTTRIIMLNLDDHETVIVEGEVVESRTLEGQTMQILLLDRLGNPRNGLVDDIAGRRQAAQRRGGSVGVGGRYAGGISNTSLAGAGLIASGGGGGACGGGVGC